MQPIHNKTYRTEDWAPEGQPKQKKPRLEGLAPIPPRIRIQNFASILEQSQYQTPSPLMKERDFQIITPNAPPASEEPTTAPSSLSDNGNNRNFIGKELMIDLRKKPFMKGEPIALNFNEMTDLSFLLKYYINEDSEIGEKDLEKLVDLTVKVKAMGQWDYLEQGKMLVEVEKVLQNYHPSAFKTWMIAIYDNGNTPMSYLNYYKFHEFLSIYYPDELPKLEQMPASDAYQVSKHVTQIQSPQEKVKILKDEWNFVQKKALQKPEPKTFLSSKAPPIPAVPAVLSQFFPATTAIQPDMLANRPFTKGVPIPLSNNEIQELCCLLMRYNNQEYGVLGQFANLTVEVKAIAQWDRDSQGAKLTEVEDLLNNCPPKIFSEWLKIIYGNEQTPRFYLNHYKFYQSLSAHRPDLCSKYNKMPLACTRELARAEDFEKQVKILEDWNPGEKGKAAEKALLRVIHAAFPKGHHRKK